MFDKLEDLVRRFEEITNELTEPSVVNDQNRFRKLMKEQSDLQPLVDAYTEYRKCQETVEDSLAMLESESDDEMREMLKEEMSDAKKRIIELEQEMKILMMRRTLSWRSVPVQVEMRQLCSQLRSIGCMCIMQSPNAGRRRSWSATRSVSAV